jgi:SAM-dependent methyltransferase
VAGYTADLAWIHHTGFGDYARNAAPGLLNLLRHRGVDRGLVVDLGCGSGIWARELTNAGYQVLGVDISPAMIRLARREAPVARFRIGSLLDVELPPCDAVTSLGECINYTFDGRTGPLALRHLFRRVHTALRPAGVFVFDFAEPGIGARRVFTEGDGWAVLAESSERSGVLVRRITSFRRVGRLYRRTEEIHRLRLYRAADLLAALRACGFRARRLRAYGDFPPLPGRAIIMASP